MGRPFKPTCDKHGLPRVKGQVCPQCKNESAKRIGKEKYHSDPEYRQRKIDAAVAYQKANSDKVNAAHKDWAARNREAVNAYSREYYIQNRAKKRMQKLTWKINNPDAVRVMVHRRRAAYKAGGHLSAAQWRGICEGQDHKCFDCGEAKPLTIGHIVPLSKGGGNHAENIIAQCQSCNSKQGRQIHPKFREAFDG